MSTVNVSFPTGKTTALPIEVYNTPLARIAAESIRSNLQAQFNAGTITSYTVTSSPDGTVTAPAGNSELIVNTEDPFLVPDSTSVVLIPTGYAATLVGSNNTTKLDVVAGTTGINLFTNAGTGTVLVGGGDNLIQTKTADTSGAHTIITGDGNDVIKLFSGNNTVAAGGGTNILTLGTGNNTVISTGNDVINAKTNPTPATDLINALCNSNSVSVTGGNNKITFLNGSGVSSFNGGTGSDTVFAGAGGGTYQGGTAGNNRLIAGIGQVTLTGGGNGDVLTLTVGSASDLVVAGAGNETLNGGFATGTNTFRAGTGNDTITGGKGANLFQFVNGSAGGMDTITNFAQSSGNRINLQGYGPNEVNNAVATQTNSGGSTILTLSDSTKITLTGVSHVTASNFA